MAVALLASGACWGGDVKEQLSSETQAAEAALRQVCAGVASALEPVDRKHFEEAQQKWLAFRDAEASFQAGLTSMGGSAYSTDYQAERLAMTRERIKLLKKVLESVK
ncbi:lysozyme inhibitor LprI family protein [Prosthecobacter sp.]|uniref:lysozyme inhibitor LprI family protein n=1 Tax=Prosthecobacter sp. TaxID=1965333 RepID=UPI003783CA83